MPDVLLTPIYTVRVTNEMVELLASKQLTTATLVDLPRLAQLATLDDVFHHIYAQSEDVDFTSLTLNLGLNNFLSSATNVEWLNGVKDQYISYVQRREDEKKIHKIPTKLLQVKPYNCLELFHDNNKICLPHVSMDGAFYVIFKDLADEFKHTKSESGLNETEYQFKRSILSLLYDYMGFEALRQSKAFRYLLTPGQ